MNLDELKNSMAALEDALAEKSGEPIRFNTDTCNTAQKRIMRKYRKISILSLTIGIMLLLQWNFGDFREDIFPFPYKLFLEVIIVTTAIWSFFLYEKTKRISIFSFTPRQTMRQVASLRCYALSGEIAITIATTVFITLFLSNLWQLRIFSFWIIIATLAVSITLSLTIYLPRIIRDFSNLTSPM